MADDKESLEEQVIALRRALAESNVRNQRLISLVNRQYGYGSASLFNRGGQSSSEQEDVNALVVDPESGTLGGSGVATSPAEPSFLASFWDRGSMLAMLLLFQSFSSFILAHHEDLLKKHPTIVFYLTALVGAGGNAGNQAAVRIIRALALGLISEKNHNVFLQKELCMAFALSFLLGFVLILRSFMSTVTYIETQTVLASIFAIVFLSVNLGALLPLLLQRVGVDPAHAGTIIQVLMDISGVLITCRVAQLLMGVD